MTELLELLGGWEGYTSIKEMRRPADWDRRLKEAASLIFNDSGMPLHRQQFLLRESLGTADFPYLFADTIDRSLLAGYQAIESEWKKYMRVDTVNRLYPHIGAKRFAITNSGMKLARIAPKGEYLALKKTEEKYDIYGYKFGNQLDIAWEAIIADDLGALRKTPEEMAWLVANTEHYEAVNCYADDVGTHTANANLYEVGVNSGVLPLTIANLETTVALMQAFRHPSGQPMRNRPKYLVVSDGGLEFTARQILTSSNKMWLNDSDDVTPPAPYPTNNVIAQYGLQLIVDPWLALTGTDGYRDNSWYLFADPNQIAAVECDYLQGHERPEICMKSSNKVAIGGTSPLSAMTGDFETDNILYRVRQCFGANKLDWRATYMNRVAD